MKRTIFLSIMISFVCMHISCVSALDSSGSSYFNNTVPATEEGEVIIYSDIENEEKNTFTDFFIFLKSQTIENTVSEGGTFPPVPETFVSPYTMSVPAHSNQGSFKLDSVRVTGMDDEMSRQILDKIEKLELNYFTQDGEPSRFGFTVSLGSTDILSYSLQSGDPYYAGSSFLGNNTYMIYDSDQFEEKLVTAIYNQMENMSKDSTSQLPPLDTVLTFISSIREQKKLTQKETSSPGLSNLNQQIDPSALLTWFASISGRFVPAEPEPNPAYRYTDMPTGLPIYQWPDRSDLPDPQRAVSSTTAVFSGNDIADLMDVFAKFFSNNPDLAGPINQYLSMHIQDAMMEVSNGDYLTPMLAELREDAIRDLQDLVINLKMDMTENGEICYASLLFVKNTGKLVSGANFSFISSQNDIRVTDMAADMFTGDEITPLFRGLITGSGDGNGKNTVNALFGSDSDNSFEYAQTSTSLKSAFSASITDSNIDFRISDFSGTAAILSTASPNSFAGTDSVSQLTMQFSYAGEPMGSLSAVLENKAAAPLPALTSNDAIRASEMEAVDYSILASSVLMQLMMLTMSFM